MFEALICSEFSRIFTLLTPGGRGAKDPLVGNYPRHFIGYFFSQSYNISDMDHTFKYFHILKIYHIFPVWGKNMIFSNKKVLLLSCVNQKPSLSVFFLFTSFSSFFFPISPFSFLSFPLFFLSLLLFLLRLVIISFPQPLKSSYLCKSKYTVLSLGNWTRPKRLKTKRNPCANKEKHSRGGPRKS